MKKRGFKVLLVLLVLLFTISFAAACGNGGTEPTTHAVHFSSEGEGISNLRVTVAGITGMILSGIPINEGSEARIRWTTATDHTSRLYVNNVEQADANGDVTITITAATTILVVGEAPEAAFAVPSVVINHIGAFRGGNNSTRVSHEFIEFYNASNETVDISDWILNFYTTHEVENADENQRPTPGYTTFPQGTYIPAFHSFLIRGSYNRNGQANLLVWEIEDYDYNWSTLVMSNDHNRFILSDGDGNVVDAVGLGNQPSEEGVAAAISRQDPTRRIYFRDSDNNDSDFQSINFRDPPFSISQGASGTEDQITAARPHLDAIRPRTTADGAWGQDLIVAATAVELEAPLEPVLVDATARLSPAFTPATATIQRGNWTSGDTAIATVSRTGVVTGVSAGPVTISFVSHDGDFVATASVTVEGAELTDAPVIINHIGAWRGGNAESPATHDFIELFNRSNSAVDISGWTLQYQTTAVGTDDPNATPYTLTFPEGTIIQPSYSLLIRGAANATAAFTGRPNPPVVDLANTYDISRPNLVLNNGNTNTFTLRDGVIIVDRVTATVAAAAIPGGDGSGASRQNSIRRINFQDTNQLSDWQSIRLHALPSGVELDQMRPRASTDGAQGVAP